MTPLRLLLATLPLMLSACAGTGVAGPPAPRVVTLQPGQQLDLVGGAKLTYDSVTDSRCPPTVRCIWAGELLYHFTLATSGATDNFTLGPTNADHIAPASATRVTLDVSKVPPPQQPGAALTLQPVTLTVSHP
jgi:hypothetical protein